MGHQRECLIAFLCVGIALTSSASRKEELEKAAELAVEKAAERAAERAVEKALDGGNTTTESKLIRESYSNVRKDPRKEKEADDDFGDSGESPVNDEVEPEEDADDWSRYSQDSTFAPRRTRDKDFHAWSRKIDFKGTTDTWQRFPRSEWSHEDTSWDKPKEKIVTVERKVPVPVTIEKKIPYSVYERVPYEIKVPVSQPYMVEKRVPHPVKVYMNVPVETPQPYQVEKQVPHALEEFPVFCNFSQWLRRWPRL
ncbi:uncharacterized protein LOC143902697 [Temnothorax americanus]|uniref:uncharacterized protein LOC143902697 n=1 Tax=Temnothorax americanus TaxID=1964332 RepID=UPI0040698C38